jgi:hyperosmotically inducible periplasmic protein
MKNTCKQISSVCVALATLALPIVATTTLVGCAGSNSERSTGQYIDDQSLTMRVKNALGHNSEYKFDNVSVTTFRGTVQLNGFVTNSEQKSRAEELAREVQGVQRIENNISIKENVSQK